MKRRMGRKRRASSPIPGDEMSPVQIVSMLGSVDIVVSYADGRPPTHIKFDMSVEFVEKLLVEEAQHRMTISGRLLPTVDPLQVANPHEN